MAQVKLKEESQVEDHSVIKKFKEEPDHKSAQTSEDACPILNVKEEPEEVRIKPESHEDCPYIHVIVKTEDKEEDSDGAGVVLDKHPKSEEHGETSSDTDDSENWPSSAKRLTPQTHGNREDAERTEECCSSDSEWSWEFNSPTKTPTRTKRKMEDPDQSPQTKEHKCPECGKVFPHSVRLRKHQLSHAAKCPVCAKEYTEIRILRVHMRTHTGEKPFNCSICSKRFAFKYALNQHMKTHTGDKPFKCSVCQKDFRTDSDLKRHMRTHTGERPFKCPVCVKDYADKRYLIRHMRTHTEEGPFK